MAVYPQHSREVQEGTEPAWRSFPDNIHGGAARNFAEWPKGSKAAKRMIVRVRTNAFIITVQGGGEST